MNNKQGNNKNKISNNKNHILRGYRSLYIVLLLVIILVFAAVYSLEKIKTQISSIVKENMNAIVETSDEALNVWMHHLIDFCQTTTGRPDVRKAIEELYSLPRSKDELIRSSALGELRSIIGPELDRHDLEGIFVITSDGISIASMRDENLGTANFLMEHGDYLTRIFEGQPQLILPLPSDVALPDSTGELSINEPTMFIGIPLIDADGSIFAAFTIRINPTLDFSRILQIARKGETGDLYAFDENGWLISETRFSEQLKQMGLLSLNKRAILSLSLRDPGGDMVEGYRPKIPRETMPLTTMVSQALSEGAGFNLDGYRDYRGVAVVGSWLWSDEYHFGIGYEMGVEEAFRPYFTIRNIFIFLFLLAVSLLISFLLILIVSKKKVELAVHEREIAALQLEEHRDSLERLVEERTLELEQDILKRKKVETHLQLSMEMFETLYNLSMLADEPEQVLKDYALESCVSMTESRIGYLYFMNDEETILTLHAWSKDVMKDCEILEKQAVYAVEETGLWGEAVRRRKPVITNDYDAPNPHKKGIPEGHVPIKRHMNIPVMDNGKIVLIAGVGNKEKPYDDADIHKLSLIMEGMWRIVARKKANELIRDAETRYRTVADFTYDWEYWEMPDGSLSFVSPSCERVTGYAPDQFISNPNLLEEIILPEDRDNFIEHHNEADRENCKHEIQFRIRTKNGDIIWIEHVCQPVRDEEDKFLGYRGSNRDITKRKTEEEFRRQQEEQYHTLVGALTEGIVLQDAEGGIIDCNTSAESILGLKKDQMMGCSFADPRWKSILPDGSLLPGETHPAMLTLKTGVPQQNIVMGVHKPDATFTWISVNSNPLYKSGMSNPYAVVTSFTDITEIMQSQQQLQTQLQWMTSRNSISRAIAGKTDIKSVSRIALKYLHATFSYEIGGAGIIENINNNMLIYSIFPSDLPIFSDVSMEDDIKIHLKSNFITRLKIDEVNKLNLNNFDKDFIEGFQSSLIDKLGEYQLGACIFLPISLENGDTLILALAFRDPIELDDYEENYLMGIAEDIKVALHSDKLYNELKQSYKSLKMAQSKILEQERLNAMGQMASGIAHDINNTLAPITLYTDALLEGKEELSDLARRFLKTIQEAAKDIEGTIGRLRKFYRKPDELAKERQVIDVSVLLDQIITMTSPRWKTMSQKNGITISIQKEFSERNIKLIGIESEIREAMMNLVFNAVDAMPSGGGIILRAVKNDHGVVLEVEDAGSGMTDEQRQQCLEPFFTTKGEKGTGLGLSMVFGVMQLHQGDMNIKSKLGAGTIISLHFPDSEPGREAGDIEETLSRLPELNVLCIDDDHIIREVLKEILEIEGHKVVTAENGSEGIEILKKAIETGSVFDVVFTDLGMPGMDGWEVGDRVKELVPAIPVLLLSGWGNLMNDDEKGSRNVDAILGKPPQIGEIRQGLNRLLANKFKDGN